MTFFLGVLALTSLRFAPAQAKLDGTGRLPAMGWNSWNEYKCDISEDVFLKVGNLLVSLGLKDLGYNYVNIDDCWSNKTQQRDNSTGRILPDYNKFPRGIKQVADEIHGLGLKLGIYSDAGTLTCGGYAGSLEHEVVDAKTFAEWEIDYLKYDNCNVPAGWKDEYRWFPENWRGGPPAEDQTAGGPEDSNESKPVPAPSGYDWTSTKTFKRYKTMSDALDAVNRTIQFSQCAWGHQHVDEWAHLTGHSMRMWGDIYPIWSGSVQGAWGIMPILNHASFFYKSTDFGSHGDWDMLEVGNGNLTLEENRSHFALWAALKSPLIIGARLDGIKPEIVEIFSNKDLIAFNQDPQFGAPAKPYKWGVNADFTWNQTHPAEYWSGQSTNGTYVFALNTLATAQNKTITFAEVPGLDAGTTYSVYDSWSGERKGSFASSYSALVKSHDTMVIRVVKA